ncbi:MAG TPA: hypothetical protein VEN78_28280 [Bradyrhizobium sp.]|nr:hypothetical protein [Bradyrhizobium sp.]
MNDAGEKILIAIISAALGFFVAWGRDAWDRRRRRAAVATTVLFDLRELEDALQALVTDPEPGEGFIPGNDEVMKGFVRDVSLFEPSTVADVLDIYHCLANVRSTQAEYAAKSISSAGYAHWIIQYYARLALSQMESARARLAREGGQETNRVEAVPPEPPKLPPIPPRAFPTAKRNPSPDAIKKFPGKSGAG